MIHKVLVVFCLFLISSVAKSSFDDKNKTNSTNPKTINTEELSNLAKSYNEVKTKMISEEKHSRKILGSLFLINKNMRKATEKRSALTNKMLSTKHNVKELARNIAKLGMKINSQRSQLKKRLKALYILGGRGILQTLFSSENSHDFDKSLKFLKIITDRDYELIKEHEENKKMMLGKRKKLNKEVKSLVLVKNKIKSQEELLTREQDYKKRLLSKLKEQRVRYLNKMRNIRDKTKLIRLVEMDEKVRELLQNSFFEQKGSLVKPIDGKIIKFYGLIQNNEFKYKLSHKGVFYRASVGTKVRGLYSGKVAFAGHLYGYGKTLIVDHGDHYYSVYAYNSELNVKEGEVIKEQQVIAKAGKSSREFGSGLYFEIRHFSDAINPNKWIFPQEGRRRL